MRVLFVLVLVLVIGCAGPRQTLDLTVSNQTTLVVAVVVNGGVLESVPPGGVRWISVSGGSGPWKVEARAPGGRVLSSMTVRPGDVREETNADGSRAMQGAAVRVDLSCGRLDMWSGPPVVGPMPGPGKPGDCEP
jgi:hypothetical protein